jgi:CBS domain-containing protein
MQQVKDVMSPQAEVISPDATTEEAAGVMKSLDIGVLPVCDEEGLVGILTDRDVVMRVIGEKRDPKAVRVGEAMTPNIIYCFEDEDVGKAASLLEAHHIHRLPVLNRERNLVGVVSIDDLAAAGEDHPIGSHLLKEMSQSSHPR